MTTENESAPIADEASDAVADLEPETPAAIIDQTTDEPVAPDAADEAAEEETASTVTEPAVEEAPAEPVAEEAAPPAPVADAEST